MFIILFPFFLGRRSYYCFVLPILGKWVDVMLSRWVAWNHRGAFFIVVFDVSLAAQWKTKKEALVKTARG
jgi:hypothetical protein